MVSNETVNHKLIELLVKLKNDQEFYGFINHVVRSGNSNTIYIDLFNQTTNEIDDILISNNTNPHFLYSFELIIETSALTFLGYSHEFYLFKLIDETDGYFDTFSGVISFEAHNNYDQFNPFLNKKCYLKVSKVSMKEKTSFRKQLNDYLNIIRPKIQIVEKYLIEPQEKESKEGIYYSQYHVGTSNCSYINFGGISKGFFNIGYTPKIKYKYQYTGFSRHKPDWIILSNLNRDCYSAAIRYGNINIFSCKWILPNTTEFNLNLIRLFFGIVNAGGEIIMLKYKANSPICTLLHDEYKFEIYYTTEYDANSNGLCLYIEYNDKFISFGNSDYNFLTKNLVKKNFDMIVMPCQGSKLKTKISLKEAFEETKEFNSHNNMREITMRNGFHTYRTDHSGNFHCHL